MRSRHTRTRRAGAMLCALAMAASLTPAQVFAESAEGMDPAPSGVEAPAAEEETPAAEANPAGPGAGEENTPAAETKPAGPGAEGPAAEEKIPAAADADGGEDATLPPEDGEYYRYNP